jgi:hypothetical protein
LRAGNSLKEKAHPVEKVAGLGPAPIAAGPDPFSFEP